MNVKDEEEHSDWFLIGPNFAIQDVKKDCSRIDFTVLWNRGIITSIQ